MTTLRISLLGPLQVAVGEMPAAFRTDAERSLLAYLAAQQGLPQRRDTLAALLSPDRPNQEALTYLRNRLTRLRSALHDDQVTPPWLTSDRKQITLRTGDDIIIDITQFERALATVETHPHRQLTGCPTCLICLQKAVDLVRGEFLAGLNFPSETWETWLLAQREHLQQRALDAMTLLRNARREQGEWAALIAIAQRQLALEPWLEAAYRALMQAYYQLGDRNAALAQYEQCAALLWEELGVEPEEATQDLQQRILEDGLETVASVARSDNLPQPMGRFVGRTAEQALLLQRLADRHVRLITVVGPGGVGKTRLAIEVGLAIKANFPDGVWFVALDAVQGGAEQIQIAVGEAAQLGQGDKQLTGEQVLALLRNKRLLLILDNCEVVLDELGFLPSWLHRAPGVVILATARAPLNFAAEAVVQLDGLLTGDEEYFTPSQLPPTWERISDLISERMVPSSGCSLDSGELGRGPAEAIFAEWGQMARADFGVTPENLPQVRRICRLVDGLPLAIALAAAWVRRRSLAQIIDAIEGSLDFLSTGLRDIDPRHRSMRAVFETSWQLLDAEAQAVLAALAVFPETFAAEAAAAVAGVTIFDLDLLCEKSLLQQQVEAKRYVMHSLLRQFAGEKLATRTPVVAQRFVDYFYHLAHNHRDDYTALQPEWRNFVAAISKAHAQAAWQMVLDFVEVVYEPWDRQLRLSDMRHGLTLALNAAAALQDHPAEAKLLLRLVELAVGQGEYAVAEARLMDALQHYIQLEDGLGIAHAKYLLGRIKSEQAQDRQALALFVESKRIFEDEGDASGIARNLNAMAYCHIMHDPESQIAQAYLQESISLQQPIPASQNYVEALLYLARITSRQGDLVTAEDYLVDATNASQAQENIEIHVMVLFERIVLSRRRNQLDAALRIGHECLALVQKIGNLRREGLVKTQLGMVYQAQKRPAQALSSFRSGLAIFIELGDLFEQAFSYSCLYELYADMGEIEQSHRSKQEALRLNAALKNPWLEEVLK